MGWITLAKDALARLRKLPQEEQDAHWRAQKENWVRGMSTPCEHGMLDFEQCGKCRGGIK